MPRVVEANVKDGEEVDVKVLDVAWLKVLDVLDVPSVFVDVWLG